MVICKVNYRLLSHLPNLFWPQQQKPFFVEVYKCTPVGAFMHRRTLYSNWKKLKILLFLILLIPRYYVHYLIRFIAVIETKPFHKFSIPIKSEGFDEGEGLACQLVFTYTAKYPDELPVIEIEDEENFDDLVDKDELLSHLTEQVMLLTSIIHYFFLFACTFLF